MIEWIGSMLSDTHHGAECAILFAVIAHMAQRSQLVLFVSLTAHLQVC